MELAEWLNQQSASDRVWLVKRLSANDVGATGGHQVGLYLPKALAFFVFPSLNQTAPTQNLDADFHLEIPSHAQARQARAIWYNNKYWQQPQPANPRDETRITRFGGKASPFQDHDNMGAVAVLSFPVAHQGQQADKPSYGWVCRSTVEEDLLEEIVGPVEPGKSLVWDPASKAEWAVTAAPLSACWLRPEQFSASWLNEYPPGVDLVAKAIELRPLPDADVDDRLIQRRDCEYDVFRSLEEAVELPRVTSGFNSLADFIARAQSVLQRRKSRSGNSLEIQLRAILLEEGFAESEDFEWKPKIEGGKIPDFLFPGAKAYEDIDHPPERLRLLAAKTTCKDRWRQVADEGSRISKKHLLTLQEGVSVSQFRQMQAAGIQLVVPKRLVAKYPSEIRDELVTLRAFLLDVRSNVLAPHA